MTDTTNSLSLRKIFYFWIPLAATWLMMSVEGPFLSALIARLSEPEYNLAAYGVAFSFALIIEAPVIMMMSASTSLVRSYHSFLKLRTFTYSLNALVTLGMIILIIPSVFYFIAQDLIELPHEVANLTHTALIILLPWPGAIGYRRFYQGILIRNNLTRRVAYGTIVRLTSMSVTALILFLIGNVAGVVVGASALSMGVSMEALASRFMASSVLKQLKAEESGSDDNLNHREILNFYYPLALTSMITLGVQPLVTFFMGQSRMALESLAVLPVLTSFVFIFRSFGLSYQEVVIALIGKDRINYKILKKFAVILSSILVGILLIIAFSPLSDIWFNKVSGLSEDLTQFARIPLMIMGIFPMLTVLISFQRALLVDAKRTKPITFATVTEFTGIIIVLFICVKLLSVIGVIAATIAFVFGRLCANAYLTGPVLKVIRGYSRMTDQLTE
jgi:progressive ankylosis protein